MKFIYFALLAGLALPVFSGDSMQIRPSESCWSCQYRFIDYNDMLDLPMPAGWSLDKLIECVVTRPPFVGVVLV